MLQSVSPKPGEIQGNLTNCIDIFLPFWTKKKKKVLLSIWYSQRHRKIMLFFVLFLYIACITKWKTQTSGSDHN